MNEYTLTLTEKEMGLLIEAANIMHIRYSRPGMTEKARNGAQAYSDLCAKLYNKMLDQDMENE